MRIGRRIALDVGKARIGVAVSDPHGILASPREFIPRFADDEQTLSLLLQLIDSEDPLEIYCGLPLNLQNASTASTEDAVQIARLLQSRTPVPVRLVDERLTTKVASTAMLSAGKNSKNQRSSIDSAAATVILEAALTFEKSKELLPGISVEDYIDER